ncbi:SDR family NAD(P)-dependent oxidoreductase [Subtercola endophyticus]|uniref:SDR family NAD(P)-dependent oxidoreductase n=1 Tax=Subtercola endophyticus TaxID=2895559 RepID=UPI001E4242F0|nr:SDR family NAD(P)-dependent oxidoreductase [Subtercola endophyticus]UFS59666.1 SDR family NAD(P)-dependent oxidoreductase [Subtercola endophyticus]
MTEPLDPVHAVIIGAGPGIGASVARRFAREGYRLTLLARNAERLEALATSIRSQGTTVDVRAVDAAEPGSLRVALEAVRAQSAGPAVLVYNAAMLVPTTLLNVSADELLEGYSVDVVGAIVAAQVFVPAMQRAKTGTVIFTSGSAAVRPSPGIATVSLGKAALRSAATMLADTVRDDGVHVVSVTVSGAVKPGTPFDPDLIADTYWRLHRQPSAEWMPEEPFDGVFDDLAAHTSAAAAGSARASDRPSA